jgi:hypothetical protein
MFPNLLYQQQPSQNFSNGGGNPYLYPLVSSGGVFPSVSLPPQAMYRGINAHICDEFSVADEQLLARVISTEKTKLSLAEIFRLLDGV